MTKHTTLEVQQALLDQGYDLGPDGADGRWGKNSAKALGQFQLNNRIAVSGIADLETLKLLFPEEFKDTHMNILGGLFTGLIGNLLNWQTIQSWLRGALLSAGGALVANGTLTQVELNTVVGAVLIVGGVIFSTLSANTKAKAIAVVKAVDAAPDVEVVGSVKEPVVVAK